jgi:putative colanic acid biosynthesis UDP-glucose lipid carrier transferase
MSVRYSKYLPALTFIGDLLLLNLALYSANYFTYHTYVPGTTSSWFILLSVICWASVSVITKCFKLSRPLVLSEHINKFLLALIYHLASLLGVIFFFQLYSFSRIEFIVSYSTFLLLVIVYRSVLFFFLDYIRKKGYNHRQVIVVGDKNISRQLTNSFFDHPEYGYDILDFISDEQILKMKSNSLPQKLLVKRPDELFICYKEMDSGLLKSIFDLCETNSIKVKVVTDLALSGNYAELVNFHNIPVLNITAEQVISRKVRVLKRSFDVTFSLGVLTLGAPVFIILYILTKLSSKGPGFYVQERVGKNHKPFYIYKFRTMHLNSEPSGPQLACDNDPRITKLGSVLRKSRLDELPQFWNVLKGEMSVVGPRPERQHFIEQLIEKSPNHKKLLRLKPGITSIGQVTFGYAQDVEQMCQRSCHDLTYLNNITLNNDIGIILKTIKVMVKFKGK